MMVGTSDQQLADLGRSMGDILIAPSAAPDHGAPAQASTRLIQFGRIAADKDLALHLYLVSGHRRFAFMWGVLGRDMMGCLVLVEPDDEEAVANACEVLGAVGESGVPAVVIGIGGNATRLSEVAARLHCSPELRTVQCNCGDRESVKQALCAVLRQMAADRAATPVLSRREAVSVPAGMA
jgi:signal recognition particle receptor subunit beta